MINKSFMSSLAVIAMLASPSALAQTASGVDGLAARAAEKGSVRVIVSFAEPATAAASVAAATPESTATADAAHRAALRATQRAILASAFGSATAEAAVNATEGATLDGRSVRLMDVVPMMALSVTQDELKKLASDPRVTAINEDGLSKPDLNQSTGLIKMSGAAGAWAKGALGTNRVVAILDTGVNKNHEFLKFNTAASKVISEACYNTKDATTYGSYSRCPGGGTSATGAGAGADCTAYDGCGHGTHVAGIAAGRNSSLNGAEPVRGVAPNASIIAVNVFSRFDRNHSSYPCGYGATKDCLLSWTSDQILALERVYALRNSLGVRKISAVNMSLGGGAYSGYCDGDSRKTVIDKLRNAGIAVVISSGNSSYRTQVGAPGCISTATTVGASSKSSGANVEKIASYSNSGMQVDVLAPGGDYPYPSPLGMAALIRSSYKGSNATYEYLAGTSMAAPHVTGAFAAIKSKAACANKTVAQIEAAMKSTGKAIADTRSGGSYTRKRIDVAATMNALGCP